MRTVTYPLCEACEGPIVSIYQGCVVLGNLLTPFGDPDVAAGVVGDNIKRIVLLGAPLTEIPAAQVKAALGRSAYHWWCLLTMAQADLGELKKHLPL